LIGAGLRGGSEARETESSGDFSLPAIVGDECEAARNLGYQREGAGKMPEVRASQSSDLKNPIEFRSQRTGWIYPSQPSQEVLDRPLFSLSGQRGTELGFKEIGGDELIETT